MHPYSLKLALPYHVANALVTQLIQRETGADEIPAMMLACRRNPDLDRLVLLEQEQERKTKRRAINDAA